jgi:hypothetical protein
MRRVVMASPFSAKNGRGISENIAYARLCLRDCLERGEAPLASHLLYTQVLDDAVEEQRRWGMEASNCWILKAEALVVYDDYGVSPGMKSDIIMAQAADIPIEFRQLENL